MIVPFERLFEGPLIYMGRKVLVTEKIFDVAGGSGQVTFKDFGGQVYNQEFRYQFTYPETTYHILKEIQRLKSLLKLEGKGHVQYFNKEDHLASVFFHSDGFDILDVNKGIRPVDFNKQEVPDGWDE